MRRPTPKIHELANPDNAALQSGRCHATLSVSAAVSANAEDNTNQPEPATTHRRNGSRPGIPEARVLTMTKVKELEATNNAAEPAIQSGRFSDPP